MVVQMVSRRQLCHGATSFRATTTVRDTRTAGQHVRDVCLRPARRTVAGRVRGEDPRCRHSSTPAMGSASTRIRRRSDGL